MILNYIHGVNVGKYSNTMDPLGLVRLASWIPKMGATGSCLFVLCLTQTPCFNKPHYYYVLSIMIYYDCYYYCYNNNNYYYLWFCYWYCSHYDCHDWIHGIIVLIDYPRDLDWIITPLTEIRQLGQRGAPSRDYWVVKVMLLFCFQILFSLKCPDFILSG